jgi:hypothetical protein
LVIDTIYTFSNSRNKIRIYRARHNDFVFVFDVTDPQFKLAGNISPRMTKELFIQKFHLTQTISDKVQISDSEGTMKFIFYFKNKRLNRIESLIYID